MLEGEPVRDGEGNVVPLIGASVGADISGLNENGMYSKS